MATFFGIPWRCKDEDERMVVCCAVESHSLVNGTIRITFVTETLM